MLAHIIMCIMVRHPTKVHRDSSKALTIACYTIYAKKTDIIAVLEVSLKPFSDTELHVYTAPKTSTY